MPDHHDESDFVDTEYQDTRGSAYQGSLNTRPNRPPSREELDLKAQETQKRLEELRRVQDQLEQERTSLEEARRRRTEYHTGREETLQNLTRGVGLLEEAEFTARQRAEQLAQTLADLRDHQEKVGALNDQTWTQEAYTTELTRALTTLENARMEWNSARLKWPLLNPGTADEQVDPPSKAAATEALDSLSFGRLCRLGLALTWPLALVLLLAGVAFAVALFTRFQ